MYIYIYRFIHTHFNSPENIYTTNLPEKSWTKVPHSWVKMPPDRLASPALPSLKPTTKAPRNRAFAGSFRFQEVYNLWGFTLYPQGSWVFCFSIQHVAHVECLDLLIITSHSTNIQTNECISVNQKKFQQPPNCCILSKSFWIQY